MENINFDDAIRRLEEVGKIMKAKGQRLPEIDNTELAEENMILRQEIARLKEMLEAEQGKVRMLMKEIAAGSGILSQRSQTAGISREAEGQE